LLNKSKPIIHKIEFTEEEQQEIQSILSGQATRRQIKLWKEKGLAAKKNYNVGSERGRKKIVKERYYHGLCSTCHELPDYKLTFDIDGAGLVEHWCQKHLPSEYKTV